MKVIKIERESRDIVIAYTSRKIIRFQASAWLELTADKYEIRLLTRRRWHPDRVSLKVWDSTSCKKIYFRYCFLDSVIPLTLNNLL